MKIDNRINYKIVLDTETCPMDSTVTEVDANNMLVYDIGWVITDKRGNIYAKRSYIVADIYIGEKSLMQSAYYANKLPMYEKDLSNGTRKLASFYNIHKALMQDIADYNIKEVYAYNMRFDYYALNQTCRWLTKSKYRYMFPKDIQICDIMKMARDVIEPTPTYQNFCRSNNYLTNHKTPRVQLKAETIHRYLTNDTTFDESHTALEDSLIETDILAYCYRKHKKMRRVLFEN